MGQPTQLNELTLTTEHTDWITDIAEMHTKFGVNTIIRTFDQDKLRTFLQFRIDFLQEELDEMIEAFEEGVPEDIVDSLVDLCVVAIGTLDAFDINAYEAWNRVHKKNMQKEAGIKPSRPNPLGMPDLIKPEGWSAPTHVDNVGLLARCFNE